MGKEANIASHNLSQKGRLKIAPNWPRRPDLFPYNPYSVPENPPPCTKIDSDILSYLEPPRQAAKKLRIPRPRSSGVSAS